MPHELLSHRIAVAQASGKHLLAELLAEQERLFFSHRLRLRSRCEEPNTPAVLHWNAPDLQEPRA
jgi:hypothetical protein